ncbi:MAG: anti-sigma factor family protein [Solirubrobacteraceae bacterium]
MHDFVSRPRFWRDHRWAPPHMSDYLDGELAAGGRTRMERHVGECRECRTVLVELRLVIDRLRRMPAPADGGGASQIAAAVRVRLSQPPGS